MFKKLSFILLLIALVVGFASMGFSADKGNSRKGKYTFKKSCRSCHNDTGTAMSLSPDSKTQAQWERVFAPGKYEKLVCKDEWVKIPEPDRLDIFAYLHQYAFDSPTPAKCK
ncbi:MAG: cytochrome c [Proteobacteria bacterium]|nr:cytochrome c [Desulfobacula sp.]MBU3951717.1 cytochrome c [Pseudomonadota bacterium]MBU4131687.1 cytochrome c [Pseudomonadota bacterium]